MKRSGRYRGSRRGGGVIIPVLVVLCLIAAGALYVINNNMTFTREGSFFLPERSQKEPEKVEANLIIDSGEEEIETNVNLNEELPSQSEVSEKTKAMFVPIGSVKNIELFMAELDSAAQKGIETLVLEVKAEDGALAFSTATKIGQSTLLSGDDGIFTENLKLARDRGYRIAFYLSCFKDNEAARRNQEYSARTENKIIWLDGENVRWLSAYSENARGYVTALMEELRAFSPDEFILSNISFPVYGKTELISYPDGGKGKSEILRGFIEEARSAAGDVPLSAVYENYSGGYLEKSGQKAEDFTVFDKLYISREGGKLSSPISDAGIQHDRIIPIQSDISDDDFLIKE